MAVAPVMTLGVVPRKETILQSQTTAKKCSGLSSRRDFLAWWLSMFLPKSNFLRLPRSTLWLRTTTGKSDLFHEVSYLMAFQYLSLY